MPCRIRFQPRCGCLGVFCPMPELVRSRPSRRISARRLDPEMGGGQGHGSIRLMAETSSTGSRKPMKKPRTALWLSALSRRELTQTGGTITASSMKFDLLGVDSNSAGLKLPHHSPQRWSLWVKNSPQMSTFTSLQNRTYRAQKCDLRHKVTLLRFFTLLWPPLYIAA